MIYIFFDLEKAYDTTWRYRILKRLHDFGLRGQMAKFIQGFLGARNFHVRVGTSYSPSNEKKEGVPQGNDLNVTLFAVGINSIKKSLLEGVSSSLYVHNVALWRSASWMSTEKQRLQQGIRMDWGTWLPVLTYQIGSCALLPPKKPPSRPWSHHVRFTSTCYVMGKHKFLGLVFHRRLIEHPHLKVLKTKCMRSFDLLRVLPCTS